MTPSTVTDHNLDPGEARERCPLPADQSSHLPRYRDLDSAKPVAPRNLSPQSVPHELRHAHHPAQARHEKQRELLPLHCAGWQKRVRAYTHASRSAGNVRTRNHQAAHLAANLLILLALLANCRLICGDNLDAQDRNGTKRARAVSTGGIPLRASELWRVLKYKCHLVRIRRARSSPGTTHTCPHCHHPPKRMPRLLLPSRRAIKW